MAGPGRPALTMSMRGLTGLDVQVDRKGAPGHAGHLGGAIPDPLAAMAEMLAGLHDDTGKITVPGFYREVSGTGDHRDDFVERTTTRPALTVTGLAGGGVGRRTQATIGTRARASLDIRLVPDQTPTAIATAVARRLRELAPEGIHVRVRLRAAVPPVQVDPRHPATRIAAAALADAFGARPEAIRSGGSNPAVAALVRAGIPVVLMGFSVPDDHIHGPDERLHLPTFFRAIVASASLLDRMRLLVPR
jgi:acetylornithine deacetylase/succinyl-diaminopimelate desuccinylase-like protein